MNRTTRDAIAKAGFYPTQAAFNFEDELRTRLGLTNRYDTARLSIGRSLAVPDIPTPLERDETRNTTSIRGENLFGKELDLWISAIVMDNGFQESVSTDDFRQAVEAHWARGAKLLSDSWEASDKNVEDFVTGLSMLLPAGATTFSPRNISINSARPQEIRIRVGSVSESLPSSEKVGYAINGSGVSPHIALMGKTRTGKTTTGMQIVGQMVDQVELPFLIIDPKGDFLDSSALFQRLGATPSNCTILEVGEQPIPLDFLPKAEFGNVNLTSEAMVLRDSIALACRASGDVQRDSLRVAIEQVLSRGHNRNLEAIRDAYELELVASGKNKDSIVSRLNEVTSLNCFSPNMSAEDFFRRSWVLSLNRIGSEELKRLIILLVLDALKSYLLRLEDAPLESGFRGLRHILVIDEARRILAEKKYQSLVDIIRQGASKGSVVMLLSQDPSDFEGQADDFTTQLGAVISFACAQTEKGLRKLQGAYGRKVQPQEFSDTTLPKGVAFCKLPGRHAERVRCWE
ncbi:MAG: DUF87 domain-containing protein [Candidatus Hydrogenedentes bacterium]|nr:DUF87 domain-containing protein [Candidatus Hydrogenedentota bacterium]